MCQISIDFSKQGIAHDQENFDIAHPFPKDLFEAHSHIYAL